ncbi:MAG: methionine synthase [Geminicoccaceae bacterium]|nr:methionine synthase [Geminicoccaceae bacterium]MCS7268485.1 methionine synthase [Geminicoccaceae bacterium]MDW8124375.1 methionine synthase [Geminicoccaceae bacterium]MDW8340853.1 methionine synthase [Geminicoccaceae bacterium]
MVDLFEYARERVVLFDGGMGTKIQAAGLTLDDFWGLENCSEVLNLSRPDLIRDIHRKYLLAGADALETNSFGGSPITLGEFGLADRAKEINRRAAELAFEAIDSLPEDGRTRFVVGSIGPGTRLPSLGHIDYRTLEAAFAVQAEGLLEGGVHALLVETCQDPLQIKAAVNGSRIAMARTGRRVPLMVQVTVETTGTLLVGTEVAAAAVVVGALEVSALGLNCATGPKEMAEHLRTLAQIWPGLLSVQPNAGLPELREGKTFYPLLPSELAHWLERFVEEDGVNFVGGCCGTDERHIAALDAMLRRLAEDGCRPRPRPRSPKPLPALASLFSVVPMRPENAYLDIGERCNANGSKRFRELLAAGDWEACVAMGREQVREGAHALDLCTAFVGRDEVADMVQLVSRIRGQVDAPLVIDSTELPVIEAALELYGGKAVINSINFEDGEEPARARVELARKFGAAVIGLTIDEEGMAKRSEDKVRIAYRLVDFACGRLGLPPSDLFVDPLTFTICTGNEDDRKLGLWTLEAIERIARELPEVQILLGVSNISFGLAPPARQVLNSVFLDEARKRGLTAAIVHSSKIVPLHKIPDEEARIARDLVYDRRRPDYDPLQAFIALFANRRAAAPKRERPATVEERLKRRIVDGDRQGLEEDLEEALQRYDPVSIINDILLDGMKTVGELFGAGKMQLPFVLQSAETMKAAVAYLQPKMPKVEGHTKGTIVLATVKGDVHDIGKNLVDIILSNNGYKVVNLGIKQPLSNILEAAEAHKADAIGMSGLLVKSTLIMKENLEEMARNQIRIPVLLGGAALTRAFVEEDCYKAYGGRPVAYARDAFEGLLLMDKIMAGTFAAYVEERAAKAAARGGTTKKRRGFGLQEGERRPQRPVDLEEIRLRREALTRDVPVPRPPFWGSRIIERVSVRALLPYLNEQMLYQFHWGYEKQGRKLDEFLVWAQKELRPILADLVERAEREQIFEPKAAYGYFPAAGDGDDIVLFEPGSDRELVRFHLPRQQKEGGLCIADFLRDIRDPERDVIGLQVVTIGARASEVARAWFAENRYQDYVRLHGLGVELAEALAEYVHARIRAELGFAHEDARDMRQLLKQGYRGSRYSFGYPACPNLADQGPLLELLGAHRIGVELGEEDQLWPEQSTSAIVLHHPQARYFSV